MGSVPPPLLCPTLVGREAQLEELAAALDAAAAGRGRTVLVSGEAGIGKTAFLRCFANAARTRRVRVAIGECVESAARMPLGPFAGVLDSLDRQRLLRPGSPRPQADVGAIDGAARGRLYRSFRLLFAGLTCAHPLVVVIEDLHWADEASLELFAYLARSLREERVLLIGTYRSDELDRQHPLRPVLLELTRARLSDELAIPRLDRQQTAVFLRETFRGGADPTPAFRETIEERCEGNPFFIEEVLKALQQRGELVYKNSGWRPTTDSIAHAIPDSIRAAVRIRLDRLPTGALRTLQVAAVIGQSFEVDLLRRVREIDVEQLADDAHAAMEAQLVVRLELQPDLLAFRHALTRECVLSELLELERRKLHASIGLAMESGADAAERVADLAYHFDGARDSTRAHRYHVAAGEAAFRSAAFARAARHFDRAVELRLPDSDLGGLYMRLAEFEQLAGDWRRAAAADEAAWRTFSAAGDTRRAGAALRRLSRERLRLGEGDFAEMLNDVVRLLEPHGPSPELAWAYADVARHHLRVTGDPAQGREWAERAIALGREVGHAAVVADALITLGWAVDAGEGDHARGMSLVREGIDEAVRARDSETASRGYNNLTGMLKAYEVSDRRALHSEWLEFATRTGHRHLTLMLWSALWALADGDFDTVIREATEAIPSSNEMSVRLQLLPEIARTARDGPGTSAAKVRELLEAMEDRPPRFRRNLQENSVEWFLLAGDAAGAVTEAEAIRLSTHSPPELGITVSALVAARAANDQVAYARWSEIALESSNWNEARRFAARWLDADTAERNGDPVSGAAALEELADALDTPVARTLVRMRRIEVLRRVDRAAAMAELENVVAFWTKAKATWYLGELRRWASERGLRLVEPKGVRPGLLSEREREVARLVSEGLSNREIADRLIVSERTAEGHVQRIMTKLNFRSRSQIATWFTEERLAPSRL